MLVQIFGEMYGAYRDYCASRRRLTKDYLLQNHYVSDTKKRWILRWIEGLKHFLSP